MMLCALRALGQRSARRSLRLLLLLAGLLSLLLRPPPAAAQHGLLPPPDRPLHERLAAAQAVAFGTIARVEEGRIAIEDVRVIRGELESDLLVKRAPSRPPPWAEGDRVLLLLAGARSPYRWVEKPVEALPALDGPESEDRLERAVRALDAVRAEPPARRDLHARWCDEGPDALRALGLRGLLDVPGMAGVMDAPFARDRARVASDPSRSLPVRRAATRVATRHPAGIEAMLDHLGEAGHESDPEIADIVLQAALRIRLPAAEARLAELLPDSHGPLGEVVLRLSAHAVGEEVERRLSELAVGHPDAEVRSGATRSLERLRRNRRSRGG